MTNLKDLLNNYGYFLIFFLIFLLIITIIILITNHKKAKGSIYLTGLFLDYTKEQTYTLSLIIINFLLLIYTLLFKINLTLSLSLISTSMIIIAFLIIKNYKYILINFIINLINIFVLYLANLVNILRINNANPGYLVLQIFTNIFGILFFLFTAIKFIKDNQIKGDTYEKNN